MSELQKVYSGMHQVDTRLFDQVWAPKTFNDFAKYTSYLSGVVGSRAIWRGHSNIDWQLHSAAIRRILKFGWGDYNGVNAKNAALPYKTSILRQMLNQYESSLLNEARMKGHDFHEGRRLNDLELFAVLQHFGAATRLIDFTRNAFIALWFACCSHKEEFGVVFLGRLETIHEKAVWLSDLNDSEKNICEMMKKYKGSICLWEPRHVYHRMKVQQGVFLISEPVANTWGSLPIKRIAKTNPDKYDYDNGLVPIAIAPALKHEMNSLDSNLFGSMFGYSLPTLFPEIDGYSRFHGADQDYELHFVFPKNEY
jgi:hypothetical protein